MKPEVISDFIRMKNIILLKSLIVLTLMSCSVRVNRISNEDFSPNDFGLLQARTGIERYQVLLRTHQAALTAGVNVNYIGIKQIDIEIPDDFEQIPLTQYNDFKGCVINITNCQKKVCLFGSERKGTSINIGKNAIASGYYSAYVPLARGKHLLIVEDANPWVEKRLGYQYGHTRKDVILIENGKALNSPVMPYDNEASSPQCFFISVLLKPLVIKNLTVNRTPNCSYVTNIFYVSGYNDVQISNIIINTPENKLSDDSAIRVYNSTNVSLNDVCIEGTYSQLNRSGYGVSLGNVWNFRALRLYAKGNSGVFGTNNINVAYLEDCNINRFDIHCYGRDVIFNNVIFTDYHNQYSSVFGSIHHQGCTFTDFVPLSIETSYNAYVGFDVFFDDCVFNAAKDRNFLLGIGYVNNNNNKRRELSQKCWPNVYINNMTVNLAYGQDSFIVLKNVSEGLIQPTIGNIKEIKINGLVINTADKPFKHLLLSNNHIKTQYDIDCEIRNVIINDYPMVKSSTARMVDRGASIRANLPILNNTIRISNAESLHQE